MKKISTLLVSLLVVVLTAGAAVYPVSSSTNWNSLVGGSCTNCVFNIASGVTLTLNNNGVYCAGCTFNGGTVLLSNDFTVQYSAFDNTTVTINGQKLNLQAGSADNTFSNATVTANGSGSINQTGKTTITNSSFGLNGQAQYFENGGQLDIVGSRFYLMDNSSFYANAGPVNLNSNSNITAGDGTAASKAYIYLNGPQFVLVDANSTFSLANSNNYYFNWSAYKSTSNGMTYNTATNVANCGTPGKNSCSAPKYYGCAMFSKSGATNCTVLAAMISGLSGSLISGNQVKLNWSLQGTEEGTIAVERSSDAVHFEVINSLSTRTTTDYSFNDANPASGLNYYRITLTAFDGVKTVSGILSVHAAASSTAAGPQIFPNPVTGGRFTLRVANTQPVLLSVFSQEGRLVTGSTLSGQTEYAVTLPKTTATGLLLVRIISGDQTTSFPLLNKQ